LEVGKNEKYFCIRCADFGADSARKPLSAGLALPVLSKLDAFIGRYINLLPFGPHPKARATKFRKAGIFAIYPAKQPNSWSISP